MLSSTSVNPEVNNDPQMTLLERYDSFCTRQEGKEFLWYSISFISLVGSIMPIALICMTYTPWFYSFVFVSMLLFFGNILTVIGRASMHVIITFYLATVLVHIIVPLHSFLLVQSMA